MAFRFQVFHRASNTEIFIDNFAVNSTLKSRNERKRMTKHDDLEQFFAMAEDQDFDFLRSNASPDVPVATYRWCRNDTVSGCPVRTIVEPGEKSMKEAGLKRVVCHDNHLRGDTNTGQRVKMTVLRSGQSSMYLLITAGMPGTRDEAKEINARLAQRIEQLAREWKETARPDA